MTLQDLNGHLDMVLQLQDARESLENMQAKILGAQQYDGMPHAHEESRKVENLSILLDSHTDEVERLNRLVSQSEITVRAWVDEIPNLYTRAIFNLRFLCGLKWEEIPDYIGANSTEAVKNTVYRYLNTSSEAE